MTLALHEYEERIEELEVTLRQVIDWFGVHTEEHKPWHSGTIEMLMDARRVLNNDDDEDD